MTYNEAIGYLKSSARFGKKHSLSDFKAFLEALGSPQKGLNIIHTAGTNGKGSFCAYTESILRQAGYTVGTFTSPHLVKYNERISLNGESISDCDFAAEIGFIAQKSEEFWGNTKFSFFEIITAAALSFFGKRRPDFIILETGLGGRLDATNAIADPLFTAIMKIDLDHTEYLGNTIEEIAYEKACIIKENRPCVLSPDQERAYTVVRKKAEKKRSKLYYCPKPKVNIVKSDLEGIVFDAACEHFSYKGLKSKMAGCFQPYNIFTVLLGIEVLKAQGFKITDEAVYKGIEKAKIKGRMEILSNDPLIIADGAHNLNAAEEFSAFLKGLGRCKGKITLITGVLSDKNPEKLIYKLAEAADRVILTLPPSERAYDPSDLKIEGKETYFCHNLKTALLKALKFNDANDGIIFITGSLYLVGEAEELFSCRH